LVIDPSSAFVSYSREDSDFVVRLVKDLKAKGAKIWMDRVDIRPGQRWEQQVETALNGCSRMLVILSPTSLSSRNVLAEAAFAIDEGKEVIPVLYLECKIPFRLRPFQYADFRTSYEEGLGSLLATLSSEKETAEPTARTRIANAYPAEHERKGAEEKEAARKAEQDRIERGKRELANQSQREEVEDSQTSAPSPGPVAKRRERLAARDRSRALASQGTSKLPAISTGPADKPKLILHVVRYFPVVCGILVLIVGGFAYQWFKRTNVRGLRNDVQAQPRRTQDAIHSSSVETGPSPQASQSSQRPVEPAKLPATPVSVTKKKTKSQHYNGELWSGWPNFPTTRATNDVQANKSNAPDDSAPSSQANGNSGSVQQVPTVTQSAQPEAASNPSLDADAKVQIVQEAFKEKDWEKVVSLSRELADIGDPRGMYYLGRVYTLGVGVPKSWEQEKYWYEKSAAAGYCYAMYMLGISYNANYHSEHAREWFTKGAAAQPPECASLCAKRIQRP
jgi:hypothetical protein